MSEKIAKLIIYTLIFSLDVLLAISGYHISEGDTLSFIAGILLFVYVLALHITFIKEVAKELDNDRDTFYQIKTELEAWEVVKDKINITEYYDNEQDYEEDINSHNALCLNSNLKIQNSNNEEDWFIPLDNEDCKKLKKALEVDKC